MFKSIIQNLVEGKNLTEDEIIGAMKCIMEGNATQAQIGSFLTALRIKGETIEEITGCAKVMRDKASRINPVVEYCIDTCGTGGDGANTFNISTAAAIIAAAGGVAVAKHGNRSVSSRSGSADVFEALGINIALEPEQVKSCIEEIGIGFMFAQTFHKSMKHVAGARKELGIRSIFNILGPLTNPANAGGQVLGVFNEKLTASIAAVLKNLGVERAMVVHGMDGLDEISICDVTKVFEVRGGEVINYELHPEMFGMKRASREAIAGGDGKENAALIKGIFNGMTGPKRDVVLLNAAAALYVGRKAESMADGILLAENLIDSGKAAEKLEELAVFSQTISSKNLI